MNRYIFYQQFLLTILLYEIKIFFASLFWSEISGQQKELEIIFWNHYFLFSINIPQSDRSCLEAF